MTKKVTESKFSPLK